MGAGRRVRDGRRDHARGVTSDGLAELPTLKVGRDGTLYVVWTEKLADREDVYLMRLPPSASQRDDQADP